MPFLWEWVSYKTDHRENYVKVLIATFTVGVANLDLRSKFTFWFKTLQLLKASAIEINVLKAD